MAGPTILSTELSEFAILKWNRRRQKKLPSNPDPKRSIFQDGEGPYTDVVIKCQDQQWRAHAIILMHACEFFRACLDSDCVEGRSRTIAMDDDDPAACGIFLSFLYTWRSQLMDLQYGGHTLRAAIKSADKPLISELLLNICSMADKYDVPELTEVVIDLVEWDEVFYKDINSSTGQLYYLSQMAAEEEDEEDRLGDFSGGQVRDHMMLNFYIGTLDFADTSINKLLQEALINNLACRFASHRRVSAMSEEILKQHPEVLSRIFSAVLKTPWTAVEQEDIALDMVRGLPASFWDPNVEDPGDDFPVSEKDEHQEPEDSRDRG